MPTKLRTYEPPPAHQSYAGVVISLARQEHPDTSAYQDPEIVWRLDKPHHVGLLAASDDRERVTSLLDEYSRRFYEDFHATMPPLERAPS